MDGNTALAPRNHNMPPDMVEEFKADLPVTYLHLVERKDELLAGGKNYPEVIEDDDQLGLCADFLDQVADFCKSVEAKRVVVKDPLLKSERVVDGFFNGIKGALADMTKGLNARRLSYLKIKEDREKEERDKLAAKAREDAALLVREAQAREKSAADIIDQQRRDAEAQEVNARQVAQAKIDATPAGIKRDTLIEIEDERRQTAAAALDEIGANVPVDEHVVKLREEARQREEEASRQENTKVADLTKVRGTYGSVSSLSAIWVGTVANWEALNGTLGPLAPHLKAEEIEDAIKRFVKAGGRALPGVIITEERKLNR